MSELSKYAYGSMPLSQGYRLVWDATNIAIGTPSEHEYKREIMSYEIGRLFDKLDMVKEDFAPMAHWFKEEPGVSLDDLTGDLKAKQQALYAEEQAGRIEPINPFHVHDEQMLAIDSLLFYLEAAYNSADRSTA